jgi:prepilin-type N-terminal cleavage/methylation domain-containing protein
MRPRTPDDDGFTLIEVLTAVAVISIVLTATTALFVRSMTMVNAQGARQAAFQVATDGLEALRSVSGTQAQTWLAGHAATETILVNAVPYQRNWTVDTTTPGLLSATVSVAWPERECPAAGCVFTATTLISTATAEPVFEAA